MCVLWSHLHYSFQHRLNDEHDNVHFQQSNPSNLFPEQLVSRAGQQAARHSMGTRAGLALVSEGLVESCVASIAMADLGFGRRCSGYFGC
jgi:hypothetical protein